MEIKNKVLKIDLFDKTYYKYCFSRLLLSIIYYYNGNLLPFIANDIFVYILLDLERYTGLNKHNITVKSELDIFLEYGIDIESISFEESSDYIIRGIKTALNYNAPVFVPIDKFNFKPNSKVNDGYYKKVHMATFCLIYGYDEAQKTFNFAYVMPDIDEFFYDVIHYSKLVECYKGFGNNLYRNEPVELMCYYPPKKKTQNDLKLLDYKKIYTKNLFDFKSEIFVGLENIMKASQLYRNNDVYEKLVTLDLRDLRIFHRLRRFLQADLYRINVFFDSRKEPLIKLLGLEEDILKTIIGRMLKITTLRRYDTSSMELISSKLEELYCTEHSFYQGLFNLL